MRAGDGVFKRWVREAEAVFRPGERVGVAVSGGRDSVLLLDYLQCLAQARGLVLSVVHFNHRLRGPASDGDEQFVRDLARERGLEVRVGEADVRTAAKQNRRNLEATARELRYAYFFRLIHQGLLDKIATAHTANDQAETVLMRLVRGAGTRGLGAIYPSLEGKIFRPLLSVTRREVEEEIARRGLAFRTDESNADRRFLRNRIRAELLPQLEAEYNPEIVSLLAEMSARARHDEAFLEEQARERSKAWLVREEGVEKIPLRALEAFHPALAQRALRQMIQGVSGRLAGVTHRHIEALRRFASGAQSGQTLPLPGGIVAQKDFEWLTVRLGRQEPVKGFSYAVKIPGECAVPEIKRVFRFRIVATRREGKAYNNKGVVRLDARNMPQEMTLRNWRPGDRVRVRGAQRAEKLKELFRRQRVPVEERRMWPVLDSEQGILWVRGLELEARSRQSRGGVVIEESALVDPT